MVDSNISSTHVPRARNFKMQDWAIDDGEYFTMRDREQSEKHLYRVHIPGESATD